jgi:DeoR family transcriptional regulator of aga operon/DeoR family myo-inositol catabolism operon transcriptional repressor
VFQDVDILITSDLVNPGILREIENTGVKVIIVPYKQKLEELE